MDIKLIKLIFKDLKKDLQAINEGANERLLKEEQVRSSIYCSLRNQGYYVAAERNYDKKSEKECDLVFWKDSTSESWMEIKTSWYSPKASKKDKRRLDKNGNNSWNNKPGKQFDKWKEDIERLKKLNNSELSKYFVLVEQYHTESLFDKLCSKNKDDSDNPFKDLKYEKAEFDLIWKKAPVDKCIVRIFSFQNDSEQCI